MDKNVQWINEKKIERTIVNLETNNIKAYYAKSDDEIFQTIKDIVKDGETVSVGGSMTLFEIKIIDFLRSGIYNFLDRYKENLTQTDLKEIYRKSFSANTYFASANATLIATLDRLFFSTSFDKTMKVGASVVCARRGGCSATFDELNKYFTISNMPIAASQYWNCIHGRELGEADRDEEGKQTMRVLARNMTFLMKSIELGKKQFGLPEKEEHAFTHFIR